jgi:hypothetical protein
MWRKRPCLSLQEEDSCGKVIYIWGLSFLGKRRPVPWLIRIIVGFSPRKICIDHSVHGQCWTKRHWNRLCLPVLRHFTCQNHSISTPYQLIHHRRHVSIFLSNSPVRKFLLYWNCVYEAPLFHFSMQSHYCASVMNSESEYRRYSEICFIGNYRYVVCRHRQCNGQTTTANKRK